ncbi:tetratricopeptide repeat protein [Myroides sp. C15-4]|uniref:tetratricopeptide repeat protein n=1 Tax=Myroides sp. C15-4 TaxID=3400532 RepID=UPI003D2F6046
MKLEREIIDLGRQENYDEAIEKLQRLVLGPKTSPEAKAEAYFLKHEIYSKIGIYTEAESNLTWFLQQAERSNLPVKEYEGRYLLSTAILYCKKLAYQKAIEKLELIRNYSTDYEPTQYALYLFLEGIQKMEEKDYVRAEIDLKASIELLKQELSDYLPTVYKELLRLYAEVNDLDKAEETYEEGLHYGQLLKVQSEVFQLYRFMADYYQKIGRNKESLALAETLLVKGTAYNIPHVSSRMYFVEQKVLQESKDQQQVQTKRIQYLLFFSVCLFCLLLGISYKAYKKNRSNKELIEQENQELKTNYTSLKEEKKKQEEEPVLSERQNDILKLVKQGKTNKEIATILCISQNTVKYHLKIIYDLLKINGRSDLL